MIAIPSEKDQRVEVAELLKDRVVLVTGASRGIGAATARLLSRYGAAVAINYYNCEIDAQQLVEEIASQGRKALAVKADVRNPHQVSTMVQQVSEAFGFIDTLVLNAHIPFPIRLFLEYEWEEFESKVVEELKALFYPCKAVVPSMIEHKRGSIITVSATLSRIPREGFCAHSTAKSGLDAFVKSLALELGPYGIRVNAVAPGLIQTDATSYLSQEQLDTIAQITPLRRNGFPEEVAGAILFLASEEARFITGAYLPVGGGVQMV